MRIIRLGLLVSGCLALGFVTGWQLHRPPAPVPATAARVAPQPVTTSAAPERQARSISVLPAQVEFAPVLASTPTVGERLATLSWLAKNGMHVGLPLFDNKGVTAQFALLYGLTPEETAQLNQAYNQAKQRLDELSIQRAQLDPSSTAGNLVVTVPAFPTEGGETYSNLLATFSSVLGSERYPVFNQTSGDAFEHALGSFGLANERFEVTPMKSTNGKQLYHIQRSFSESNSWGTSEGQLFVEDLAKFYPALRSFPLPTVSTPPSK